MLRRPPTVLSITAEDIAAYEDRQERAAFRAATQQGFQQGFQQHPHQFQQQQQQYVDAGGFSSSDNEFVSDDEAMLDAYDGQQAQQQQAQQLQQQQHIHHHQQQQQAMSRAIQHGQGMQTPMQAQLQTPTPAGPGYDVGPGAPQGRGGMSNGLPEPQIPQAPQRQRAGRGAQQHGQGVGQQQMGPPGPGLGPGQGGAAVTPEARVTRSRDERIIGIPRGPGRR